MPDQDSAVVVGDGYKERDDFLPNPTDQFGTVDTSGTAGAAHSKIEEVTPVFDVAKAQNLATAARALDPDDPDVHESLVTMPQGQTLVVADPEKIKEELIAKADAVKDKPIEVSKFRGPAAKQAEESGTAAEAQAQQASGVGGSAPGSVAEESNVERQQGGQSDSAPGDNGEELRLRAEAEAKAKAEEREREEAEAKAAAAAAPKGERIKPKGAQG